MSYLFRNLFLYSSHAKYLLHNLSVALIRVLLQNVANTSYVCRQQFIKTHTTKEIMEEFC